MTGYLEIDMDKKHLTELLKNAHKKYALYSYQDVDKMEDGPIIDSDAGGTPAMNEDYWQIEVRRLQDWAEEEIQVIQLGIDITDGDTNLCTVIEYYSNGAVASCEKIFEYINGVPHPVDD